MCKFRSRLLLYNAARPFNSEFSLDKARQRAKNDIKKNYVEFIYCIERSVSHSISYLVPLIQFETAKNVKMQIVWVGGHSQSAHIYFYELFDSVSQLWQGCGPLETPGARLKNL